METGPWNWLEITKLVAGLLTPVALSIFGIYIHRVTKRFESLQWCGQKLIEKRLVIYDDLTPHFNDLLCYFTYIGCWKELNPPDVVALKRVLDKKIHLASPLFSPTFFTACENFQALCFETYTGWGQDALLRTHFQRRKDARPNDWIVAWEDSFCNSVADPKEIRNAYTQLMEVFAADIDVHPSFVIPPSGRIPHNVA